MALEPTKAGAVGRGVIVNPSDPPDIAWARYRADAIRREIEQREAEGRPKNRDHDKMLAERDMLLATIKHHETP